MVGIRPRRASRDRLATFYPAEAHLPLHRARTAQGCSSSYSKATSICILPEAVARRSGRRLASGLKMHTGIAAPQQPALGTRRLSSCSRLVAQVGAVTCSRRPNGGAAADRRLASLSVWATRGQVSARRTATRRVFHGVQYPCGHRACDRAAAATGDGTACVCVCAGGAAGGGAAGVTGRG